MKKFLSVLVLLWSCSFGEDSLTVIDSSTERFNVVAQILPITAIIGGSILAAGPHKETLQEQFPRTDNRIDDILQIAPIAELYIANQFVKNHANSVWDQTKYLAISEISTGIIVYVIKNIVQEPRPNGYNNLSFPSGHTAQAFCGATVLYHEYRESAPVIAYSGFALATTTGILRVTNNKHWVPDVIVGAGIGALVANVVYFVKPLKSWQPKKNRSTVSVTPQLKMNSLSDLELAAIVRF